MSISQKQLEANRRNAKSGGVKTEEGKEIIKHNALKHGILAEEVFLIGEEKDDFKKLEDGFRKSLKPKGELENIFVDRIISNIWRLKRCLKVEKNVMEFEANNENEIRMFDMTPNQAERESISSMMRNNLVDRILRYETTIERSIFKSLHELERIQAKRKGEVVNSPVAVDVDVSRKE
jgi:hypothetical protein